MSKRLLVTSEGRDCSKCEKFLPWSGFNKNKRNATGHQSRCRMCTTTNYSKYTRRLKKNQTHEIGFSPMIQDFILGKLQNLTHD